MPKSPSHRPGGPAEFADAAEVHGVIIGALAAHEVPVRAAGLIAEGAAGDAQKRFEAFAGECAAALREDRFSLSSSLPDDTVPLAQRVDALAAWVSGFLSGLGQAGTRLGRLDADAVDMLRDLDAVARGVSLEENASDAEERAYGELVEYIRLCAHRFYRLLG